MKWQISIDDREAIIVNLPARITGDAWLPITIDEEHFHLQWNSTLRSYYLRDERGLERCVKLRSQQMTQFPGESQRRLLEINSRGSSLIDRFETLAELLCLEAHSEKQPIAQAERLFAHQWWAKLLASQ